MIRSKALRTLDAPVDQWQRWPSDHHDSESKIGPAFDKRHIGRPSIAKQERIVERLDETVDRSEAECFIKRLHSACAREVFDSVESFRES